MKNHIAGLFITSTGGMGNSQCLVDKMYCWYIYMTLKPMETRYEPSPFIVRTKRKMNQAETFQVEL